MASGHYNGYKKNAVQGAILPLTDSIYIALVSSSYTPDVVNNKMWSDVSANEVSGTGYTAGGQQLTSVTVTEDDTNNRGVLGAANPSWSTVTFTNARYAVMYKNTGTPTTSPLICFIDLGSNQTISGATFIIQFSTSPAGIYYLG